MVVKSKVESEHVNDLRNIFEILRKHKLHLNASKCSFDIGSGKFRGYMVTHHGIEVNLDQIRTIKNLRPPWNPKEVQKFIGMTAALNRFISRSANKCQVLADLGAEFTKSPLEEEGEKQNMDGKSVWTVSLQEPLTWRVYVDGVANQRGSGVGLVLVSPKKIIIEKSLRLGFSARNNEAEYEALLVGMDMVQKMGGRTVEVFLDSRFVVGQVNGELKARDLRMQGYLSQARHLQSGFESFVL
ncbi:uncharacterized protein LOC142607626 [Castanea sativa]|uniref:uncharacterized protein LOC142607626 n=1 Tax=Castanea sativa TaxID=21020 RepID=UPI003F64FEF6